MFLLTFNGLLERTFEGAYQRTALGMAVYAIVVLKIFSPTFAKSALRCSNSNRKVSKLIICVKYSRHPLRHYSSGSASDILH